MAIVQVQCNLQSFPGHHYQSLNKSKHPLCLDVLHVQKLELFKVHSHQAKVNAMSLSL